MTIATKKEQEIIDQIINCDISFNRFEKISEMLFRRIARRQEKIRLKFGNDFLNMKNIEEIVYKINRGEI
jgi:hypothetical protein